MTFARNLRATIDQVRAIPGALGLREHTVTLRVTTWSGARVGQGTSTVTDTPITVAGGTANPRVRQLSHRDVIASGGKYTAQDIKVGPFTPEFDGGGVARDDANPPTSASPTEVRYLVTGDNLPDDGKLFVRVGDETYGEFSHYLILRSTGHTP